MHTLEICVDSLPSAIAAYKGGADRLELCSDLTAGGLTPSIGLLQQVKKHVPIPVYVLIRPRNGDFLYNQEEINVMLADIEAAKQFGADGIVCGALAPEGNIHLEQTAILMKASSPLPFTFHRAFDVTPDPIAALEALLSLKVPRLLTSGQQPDALTGAPLLKKLVEKAGNHMAILAGGGILPNTIREIIQKTRVNECHLSARAAYNSKMLYQNGNVRFTPAPGSDFSWKETSDKLVREAKAEAELAWKT